MAAVHIPVVIPGRAFWREPGIDNHHQKYGFRARGLVAPRNADGDCGRTSAFLRRESCPGDAKTASFRKRGRRECRVLDRTRGLVCKVTESLRHSLRDGRSRSCRPSTGKVYNHSKRMKEKRAVLDGVAAELRRIIGQPAVKASGQDRPQLAA
jgi:hypothetical protein